MIKHSSWDTGKLWLVGILLTGIGLAQPPADWTVNPSDFEHVMTVTGLITVNGHNSEDSSDVLAAFVGTECRGVASATAALEQWLWFLMVRANTGGETVTFKIWDADLDTVLDASNEIVFISDDAYGTVDTPFLLEAVNNYTLLVAMADSVAVDEDVNTALTILDNDIYDSLVLPAIAILVQPDHGSAQVSGSTIIYQSDLNWSGMDQLTYVVSNPWYSDTALVNIDVQPVNDPPADFNLLRPAHNTMITISPDNLADTLTFSWERSIDVEDDTLTYSFSLTGQLAILNLCTTSDSTCLLAYQEMLSAISDNGYSSITGTWQVIASDSELERSADNGPFTLTIDASSVSTEEQNHLPSEFRLYGNYPNPFNPITTIQYELPQRSDVQITIYDLIGREVTTLVSEIQDAGYKLVKWDATNVSSGMYFYQIRASDYTQTKRMLLLK